MADPLRLLTLLEVAEQLRVSPHTVRKWIRVGRLQPVRLCRRILFTREAVEQLIAGSKVTMVRDQISTRGGAQ